MEIRLAASAHGMFDTVLRFLPAGTPVSFGDPGLQSAYAACFPGDTLTLEHKQLRCVRMPCQGGFANLLLAGFDSQAAAPFDALRQLAAKAGAALEDFGAASVLIDRLDALTFAPEEEIASQICAVLPLCEYRFDKYLSVRRERPAISAVLLSQRDLTPAIQEGLHLSQAVMTARDLVNEIAETLTPAELARRCEVLGRQHGFETEVLDRAACEALDMGLFLAVARGSAEEPKFIVMRWRGGEAEQPPIAFVGKGITYDSGGLAIKRSGMEAMRFDMNGAAAVIGAMCAIADQKLPRNVTAVVAACENMVDARSYRNGDVFTSMNGQTVFVRNTDAEGRLTMADAMTYCIRTEGPSELLEVAGLTGSVCSFYGSVCAAALTTHQALFDRVAALMPVTGEKYAQMPAFEEYKALLKTPYADLDNAPAGGPGGILAGLFLAAFHEDVPFLHIDFGRMPFTDKKSDCQGEGGTGFGVKTLYHYVKNRG